MTERATVEAVNSTIRAEIARRRMNQGSLAEAIGKSQAQISARLGGTVSWTLEELYRVSSLLGVSLPELVDVQARESVQA